MWLRNRREVYVGTSVEKFAEIRQKLASNKIKYDIRTVSQFGGVPSQSFLDRAGTNSDFTNVYYAYVDKKDYDWAMEILNAK